MHRIVILGGTTEARLLAADLQRHKPDLSVILSLAGRTAAPVEMPVVTRSGGFGGPEGLADYLRAEGVDLLIDATHPFANRISHNAALAVKTSGIRMLALRRAAWVEQAGDRWMKAASPEAAAAVLGQLPRTVFLTIGRQEAGAFSAAPQHRYIVRSVDPVEPPLDVAQADYILARGPFVESQEREFLVAHAIDTIVCKNSGGDATVAKLLAARSLGIEVVMIERPEPPVGVETVETVSEALMCIETIFSQPSSPL